MYVEKFDMMKVINSVLMDWTFACGWCTKIAW